MLGLNTTLMVHTEPAARKRDVLKTLMPGHAPPDVSDSEASGAGVYHPLVDSVTSCSAVIVYVMVMFGSPNATSSPKFNPVTETTT